MEVKTITLHEFTVKLKNNWYIGVVIMSLVFAGMFGSNLYMYVHTDDNAYYTQEMDVNIEIAKTLELKETAQELLEGNEFRKLMDQEQNSPIGDEFIHNIVYGQTSLTDPGSAIYIVRVLASSKDKNEIKSFMNVVTHHAGDMFENAFDSKVSFDVLKMDRIVAGRNANLNLASPYEMYKEMHEPTAMHVIIWLLFSALCGVAIEAIWILFKDSILGKRGK